MQHNAESDRKRVTGIFAAERNARRHAFRQIMNGNRQHKQKHVVDVLIVAVFFLLKAGKLVQVRHEQIH